MRYEISSYGRVHSLLTNRILRPGLSHGYEVVNLTHLNGQPRTFRVHRLVGEAFLGPMPDGLQTRHLNGVRRDNRVENLRYGTPSENAQDSVRHGTHYSDTRGRAHCPAGHEYLGENIATNHLGERICRTCRNERRRIPEDMWRRAGRPRLSDCIRGHAYTPENTRINPDGTRSCRTCERERGREWARRRRAARKQAAA